MNNLVHSIPNVIQGNTISEPYNRLKDNSLKQFDFIVSNPPFKMDFRGSVILTDRLIIIFVSLN